MSKHPKKHNQTPQHKQPEWAFSSCPHCGQLRDWLDGVGYLCQHCTIDTGSAQPGT